MLPISVSRLFFAPSRLCVQLLVFAFVATAHAAQANDAALWDKLKQGGYVILMRHARTVPGTLDPSGFTLENCASQRNLSAEGRAQAKRLGEAFHNHAVPIGRVLSSRFCRCIDSAALAFGSVELWEMLDNTGYDGQALRETKRAAVREAASRWRSEKNLLLVTHGFNIDAATGIMPAQGEMVIVQPLGDAGLRVAGRLTVD